MTTEASSPVDGGAVSIPLANDAPETMSFESAVRSLSDDRRKLLGSTSTVTAPPAERATNPTPEPENDPPAATAETPELAVEADNAAPLEEDPSGEEPEAIETEEDLPPIEAPRSWAKEEKEAFKSWPRAAQESIARVASTREADFRRSQNEFAAKEKTLVDRIQAAEQAKQQYEANVQTAVRALEREQLREFPDIKTWDDVKALQASDPLRYQAWDLHQKELAMFTAQAKEIQERNEKEAADRWEDHKKAEDGLARKYIPELNDEKKASDLVKRAEARLYEIGFSAEDLAKLASGQASISLYDHRLQRLMHSDLKLAEIQKAKEAAVAKPVPQVQRPGTPRAANPGTTQQIQALERQLAKATGNEAIALSARIHQLERKATARR